MKIGYDVSWMSHDNDYGGVYQYATLLIDAMNKFANKDITIICNNFYRNKFDKYNVRVVVISDYYSFAELLKDIDVDVIHSPIQLHSHYTLSVPMITTLHDLQHYHYPELFHKRELDYRELYYNKSNFFSERIIVTFPHVRDDIVRFLGISSNKIDVCSFGKLKTKYASKEEIIFIKQKYDLPDRYLFYSANTWAHKNHLGLARALKFLQKHYGLSIHLVCTGYQYEEFYSVIKNEIEDLNLADMVTFLGYLSENDLFVVLQGATLSVIPTYYEAGSLPLYEAMAYEVPVICSNVTSLPETIGDTRFIFDPHNVEELARKIFEMVTDEQLQEENRANSRKRNIETSWEQSITAFLDCYQKAIDSFEEKKKNRWFIDWAGNYEFFMNDKIQALTKETEQLRSKVNDLESKKGCFLTALKKSLSLRITKPLRWLGGKL